METKLGFRTNKDRMDGKKERKTFPLSCYLMEFSCLGSLTVEGRGGNTVGVVIGPKLRLYL